MENLKAHPFRPAAQDMKPVEGWQQKTAFGFMGYDSTPGGRLVRLADVLRWLGEHPRPLPYPEALRALCDAMPADVMQWLYRAQGSDGGYAIPVPPDCMFEYPTAAQIEAKKDQARQDALQREWEAKQGRFGGVLNLKRRSATGSDPLQPVEPGLPALLRRMKAFWAGERFNGSPTIDHPKTAINYLAIPFDKAAQHWGWGRADDAVIEPPEGWTVIPKYGTQLSARHGKLVRLEDVFDWLHSGGMSAHDAVYEVFRPYHQACIEGEACDLLILNATERPSDLAWDRKTSTLPNVKFFASAFPDLGHVRFEDGSFGGLVYSMSQAALRVWRGMADVSTDHYAQFKDRKEAATDAKYGVQWPSDDALTKLLGRLAVPIKAAYRQWLYGRAVFVADDTTQTEAVPLVAATADTTTTQSEFEALRGLRLVRDDQTAPIELEPKTWGELVLFRKNHSVAVWTTAQKGVLADEFTKRGQAPGVNGVAVDMAGQLSITVSRFNELKRTANTPGMREKRNKRAAK